MTPFLSILLFLVLGIVAFVLLIVFVMVPLFRGIGWIVSSIFTAIGFIVTQIFEFIGGMIGDALRFVGALLPLFILAPLAMVNVVIGRWSAAGHFADSVKRECMVAGACLYRFFIRRPLKLFWLHGLLEGVEERVPEAVYGAPGSDKPSSRAGQFDGYTIVGSLRSGGSGGKLYIARPDDRKRRKFQTALAAIRPRHAGPVDDLGHVVIKSFTLTEGSSLPQIVRESRALECAKQLGHVLDHGMDEHRFFYVMPYHPGDHLGIITRQLHGEGGSDRLAGRQLTTLTGYVRDLVETLCRYHSGGLWHKDVKPENIIIHAPGSGEGRAHLVDLGLVTPLKSAMTLTTHGTEYFRDPEMVRQALRGVKVHQVNGAKFDIYAAGAVLYFVLENTFPAHGGLSRFSKHSPEALRWIVRRAMAEYNQRYEHADLLLSDLEFVLATRDPFAIKPAELPSMRGSTIEPPTIETITPPPSLAVSREHPERPPAHSHIAHSANPAPPARPKLHVTNWWTGAYAAGDAAPSGLGGGPAFGGRSVHDVRRTAREQIASARARAKEIRARALAHRHRVGIERQPSAALGAIVLVFVLGIIVTLYVMFASQRAIAPHIRSMNRQTEASLAQVAASTSQTQVELQKLADVLSIDRSINVSPYLLINDHPTKNDPRVQAGVQQIRDEFAAAGFTLLLDDLESEAAIRRVLPTRSEELTLTPLLAAALAECGVGGVVYIDAVPGEGAPPERLRTRIIDARELAERN